ncbi:hypothetical protein [Mycobacterium sp.]|uniref:hypothetical protein n=1 Tax=Mycobacterium sp. TaxID=1785 RepID=UPI002C0A2CFE|nr:hypothetical protein [Mycobacterium sp.]HKP42122.1 hypothetical protein [Mycobacterium sp.]
MLTSARPFQTDAPTNEDGLAAVDKRRSVLHAARSVGFIAACALAASVLGTGVAIADPTSTVTADGQVRDGNYVQAPEIVNPSPMTGCRYWQKSHAGRNDQAQQEFHKGLNNLVVNCGG